MKIPSACTRCGTPVPEFREEGWGLVEMYVFPDLSATAHVAWCPRCMEEFDFWVRERGGWNEDRRSAH